MREGLRNELRWKKQAEAGDQPGWADEPALGPQPSASAGCRPRVGVVGCGYWGSKHVRVLCSSPDVAGVAVIDPDPRASERIRSAFPMVRTFPELLPALRHVDALVVATPPRTHGVLALEALRHGKHVLVEKPLATSLAEALDLAEAARRSGATLMVGHTFEFNPAVRELKRRLAAGELGRVHYIHSARLNLGLYRPDVNVVWDLAAHDISIMNYLLDAAPAAVAAWGSANGRARVEDLAYLRLEYRELGVTGYVHVSWLDPNKVRKVTVVGSRKMAVYDDLGEERLRIFDRGVEGCEEGTAPFERPLSYRYGDIVSPYIRFEEPLALEVQHFLDCIRNGAAPQTDARDGLAVMAVLEAADRALATGRTVEVCRPGEAPAAKL